MEKVRTEAGVEVEILVNTEAMRAVDVAVFNLSPVESVELSWALNRRPVPMPFATAEAVDVPVWNRLATSTIDEVFVSANPTFKDGTEINEVDAILPDTVRYPPNIPLPPTLRPELTSRFWLN